MSTLLSKIQENNILKTDDDGELQVYCAKNPRTDLEMNVRGVIFNNDKLVYKGFPFTEELTVSDPKLLKLDIQPLFKAWSYEGTLLKFIYHNERWFCSTHRKLNAFNSRWASRDSFGHIFEQSWLHYNPNGTFATDFYNSLDKQRRYHFLLLSNKDTRIVVKPELVKEKCYLILVTDNDENPIWPLEKVANIPVTEFLQFDTINEVIDAVKSCNPFEKQGIIMYSKDFSVQYRILNSQYRSYLNVRNNISCLKYCYALCRNDPEKKQMYLELYPDSVEIVRWYEARINIIAAELLNIYKRRYIMKQYIIQSPERHGILQTLHKKYLENKKRITINDVIFLLNNYGFPGRIFKIVNMNDSIPK